MLYHVLSPFPAKIESDNIKDAIKNFVKLYYNMTINNMILKDSAQHMKAKIKYYQEDGRNKVGINMFPIKSTSLPLHSLNYIPTNFVLPPEPKKRNTNLYNNYLTTNDINSDVTMKIPLPVSAIAPPILTPVPVISTSGRHARIPVGPPVVAPIGVPVIAPIGVPVDMPGLPYRNLPSVIKYLL
jgi:hypothetical protein